MKRLTLYIGHNVKGVPTHTPEYIRHCVEKTLGIENYTQLICTGSYEGELETTSQIIISMLNEAGAKAITNMLNELAKELEQIEILCEETNAIVHIGKQSKAKKQAIA